MSILGSGAGRRANAIAMALVVLATAFTVLAGFGTGLDGALRSARYAIGDKAPSDKIALIAMDEKSLDEIGVYPWPRGTHGRLIEALQDKGVERLGFDISFTSDAPDPADDIAFARAIADSDFPVGLAVPGDDTGGEMAGTGANNVVAGIQPNARLTGAGAETFSIWADLNDEGRFEHAFRANIVDGEPMVPIAGWLAGKPPMEGRYLIDWDLNQRDIPVYSYSDVLEGRVPTEQLEGRALLVGADSSRLGDFLPIATGEYVAGARAQIIAAENVVAGLPTPIHSPIPAFLALLTGMVIMMLLTGSGRLLTLGTTGLAVVAGHALLEGRGIATFPVGEVLLVIGYCIAASIALDIARHFYSRMSTNENTGLPNLLAMKSEPSSPGTTIVLQVSNSLDILSELGTEGRDAIIVRLAQRIANALPTSRIYQIDASSLAWRASDDDAASQIETIQQLIRTGIDYGGVMVDVFINAGMEPRTDLSIERAVHNAGIASNRARARGISWEIYQEGDTDERWRIGVVSEISAAIADGQLWVAYQPKVDSGSGLVTGAEALVRWTHPERGDVRPDAFIPLLEKANRTEDLTRFMLNQAIEDFSGLPSGNIAVNVSPLMIGDGTLLAMVSDALSRHSFAPERLTIEVTESERFSDPEAIGELERIHALGVRVSIDDYGMGNSTVNYLRILPADEVKIDRSFISNVLANRSDRAVVVSTIHLAHEMGMKVVAEGVENGDVQNYLNTLDCDFIQGYHIGRPVPFDTFRETALRSWRSASGNPSTKRVA